jgi:hypothetical protein
VDITSSLEAMTWDDLINRCWCSEDLLQAICKACHKEKTKIENKARRLYRNERKKATK